MPQQPYHVYVDLDAVNNDFSSKSPPLLRFDETRDYPFLDGDSAEYFCSVVRFSIQTANSLPVFIPKMDPTSAVTVNGIPVETVYKITMQYVRAAPPPGEGEQVVLVCTLPVHFQPTYDEATIPRNGAVPPDYYYIYNYGDFLAMINSTLRNLVKDSELGTAMAGFPCCPPFMEMDPNTLKCSITADKIFFTNEMNGKPVIPVYPQPVLRLFFNSSLAALFPSFPYEPYDKSGDLNFQVIFNNQNNVNSVQLNTNPYALSLADNTVPNSVRPGIQIVQEISGVPLWNPVASLVFTTSLLPIVPTQTSTPKVFNDTSTVISASGQPNIASMLADFEVNINPTDQYRPDITYVPPGEYRLIDMYSTYNLNKLDLAVFWKDVFGNLNPFHLQPGCSAHVKLMFRRKDIYSV